MTERTKVLFLSHITSPTALVFPIERPLAEARKRGIWSVIDGAHTPGHIPLSLDTLGARFLFGQLPQRMMTPKGPASLHARPEVQGLLDPLVISHGWTKESKEPGALGAFGNSPSSTASRCRARATCPPGSPCRRPSPSARRMTGPSIADHCRAAGAGYRAPAWRA